MCVSSYMNDVSSPPKRVKPIRDNPKNRGLAGCGYPVRLVCGSDYGNDGIEYFFNTVIAGLTFAKEKCDFQSIEIFDREYRLFVEEAIIWLLE